MGEGTALRLTGHDLSVRRGGRLVLDGLDFTVAAGSALIVTGPNGVGKSTLLRAIVGLVGREAGEVTLQTDAAGAGTDLTDSCAYLGHRDAVKPALTVLENAAFWAAFLPGAGRAPEDALAAVDLIDLADLPAATLSSGQRRRLGLSRLLLAHRPVWLLDEPTAGLDAGSQDRLLTLMRAHLGAGGLIVVATHQPIDLAPAAELRLTPSGAAPDPAAEAAP